MRFAVQDVFDEIDKQAAEFSVDPQVAKAILAAENTGSGKLDPAGTVNGAAVSGKKARGVFQTLESTDLANKAQGFLDTAHSFNSADLRGQVRAGLAALKEMSLRQTRPNDPLELATMYNGGTEPWKNYTAGKLDLLPGETRKYISKVSTYLNGGTGMEYPENNNVRPPTPVPGEQQPQQRSSGTSSSTSTRTAAFDPMLLSKAMESGLNFIKNGGAADKALEIINSAGAKEAAATQMQADAITQWAKDMGDAVMAKGAVDAGNATRRSSILQAANLDPLAVDNSLSAAFSKIHATSLAAEPLGQEIDQRQAVGFFDNPLMYIVNQVRLPGMVGQYNSLVREQNRATEAVKELQALAGTGITQSQGMDADAILKSSVAQAAAQASDGKVKLGQLQSQAAGNTIREAMNALQIESGRTNMAVSLAQLTKQTMTENEGISERDAARKAEQIQIDDVNRWLKSTGSAKQYDPAMWKMLPAKARELLWEQAGKGVIGNNLAEAAQMIDQFGNLNAIAAGGDAATAQWFRTARANATKAAQNKLVIAEQQAKISGKPVKREEFLQQELENLQTLYTGQLKDMRTADDNSPYRLAYSDLAKRTEFANSAVTKYINTFGPKGDGVFSKLDEKQLMDYFSTAVVNGQMSAPQAAKEVSDFYNRAIKVQEETVKYKLFGFPPAKNYNVEIPQPGFWANLNNTKSKMPGGSIDLTSPAAVEMYLTRSVAANAQMLNQGALTDPLSNISGVPAP